MKGSCENRLSVRVLAAEDLAAYRALRLQGLRLNPEAFGAEAADEEKLPLAELARRIEPTDRAWVLGAFDNSAKLRGLMGWYRERGAKQQHRSMIWGSYVETSYRRSGVGAALLATLLERVRGVSGLRLVQLHVSSGNLAAKALYAKFGFRFVALHPESLQVAGRFVDEELWMLRVTRSD